MTLLKNLLVIIQEHKHKEDNNFNKITQLLTKINKIIIKVMFLFNIQEDYKFSNNISSKDQDSNLITNNS